MIIVHGSIVALQEERDEVLRLCLEHVARSRQEPGCISHNVSVDAEDSRRLNFFEEWEDMAALQKHFQVPESAQFVQRVTALSAQPPELRIFEASQLR